MTEQNKERSAAAVPRDLPMPRYDYKIPSPGSFSAKYEERKERDCIRIGGEHSLPNLRNAKLAAR